MKKLVSIGLLGISFSAFAENSKFFEEQRIPAAVAFIKCKHGKACNDFNKFVTHFNSQPDKTDFDVLQLIKDQSYIDTVVKELKKRKSGWFYSGSVTSEELDCFINLLENNENRQEDFKKGLDAWYIAVRILSESEEARETAQKIAQSKAELARQVAQAASDIANQQSAESKS